MAALRPRGARALTSAAAAAAAAAAGGGAPALQSLNPGSGRVMGEVAAATVGDVGTALRRAHAAQREWAAAGFAERIAVMERAAGLLRERADVLAAVLTAEMGKPLGQARGEVRATAERLIWLARNAEEAAAPREVGVRGGVREMTEYEPLGVVANIGAWNYPYFVASNVLGAALPTGSAVLFKPSEVTPLTGHVLGELLADAGVPEGVFTVLQGGKEIGAALAGSGADGVFFTGSVAAGRSVAAAAAAAPRLARVGLELGGKDAAYVRADVEDLAKAAEALADGAMYNSGQSCCSVERIFVHEDVAKEFTDALVAKVRSFVVGDPMKKDTYIGPLALTTQPDFIEGQLAASGGKVVRGAVVHPTLAVSGSYCSPAVVVNPASDSSLMTQESFGPVVAVTSVSSDEEAVAAMDRSDFGLAASVWSADEAAARAVLERLDVGTAYWNCCDRVSPQLPWSGRRSSGVGSTLGHDGLAAMLRPKAYHLRPAV